MSKKNESETVENIVALAVFGVIILVVVGFFTSGFGLLKKSEPETISNQRFSVPIENDPILGDLSKAKVVIVIFSDFECPFCKKGEETISKVKAKYGDDVALVFKNFPLTRIHPNAYSSALAGECAYEQGRFWEYHDILFSKNNALTLVDLKSYALELGLDKSRFDSCLDSQKYKYRVDQDFIIGQGVSVAATPAFFINGIALIGAQPESEFYKVVDAELKK